MQDLKSAEQGTLLDINKISKNIDFIDSIDLAHIFRIYAPNNPFTNEITTKIFKKWLNSLTFPTNLTAEDSVTSTRNTRESRKTRKTRENTREGKENTREEREELLKIISEYNILEIIPENMINEYFNYSLNNTELMLQLPPDINVIMKNIKKCELYIKTNNLQSEILQYLLNYFPAEDTRDDRKNNKDSKENDNIYVKIIEIYRINKTCLDLCIPVFGDLLVNDTENAISCLIEMFIINNNLLLDNIYQKFINRINDNNHLIRILIINGIHKIFSNSNVLDLIIITKTLDNNDKVRSLAINVVGSITQTLLTTNQFTIISGSSLVINTSNQIQHHINNMLLCIYDRLKDKKFNVRIQAIDTLMEIYQKSNNNQILVNLLIIMCSNCQKSIQRLEYYYHLFSINLVELLDENQYLAFLQIFKNRKNSIHYFKIFVNACKERNRAVFDKVMVHMHSVADIDVAPLEKIYENDSIPPLLEKLYLKYDLKIINEIEKRCRSQSTFNTLLVFINKVTMTIITPKVIKELVQTQYNNQKYVKFTNDLIRIWPDLFSFLIPEMVDKLDVLALNRLSKLDFNVSDIVPRLQNIVLQQYSRDEKKYAARILVKTNNALPIYDHIVNQLFDNPTDTKINEILTILAELAKEPSFTDRQDEIVEYIMGLLMTPETLPNEDEEWITKSKLPISSVNKIMGIKVLRNSMSVNNDTFKTSVIKLYRKILEQDGYLVPTSGVTAVWLRVIAAETLFNEKLEQQDYILLAQVVQDPIYNVRARIVDLITKTKPDNLKPNILLALLAFEPDPELQQKAQRKLCNTKGYYIYFPDLIHLISHLQENNSETIETYLKFILNSVDSAKLSEMIRVCTDIFSVSDRLYPKNELIYGVAEMAMKLGNQIRLKKGWSIEEAEGKIKLSKSIFERLDKRTKGLVAQQIAEKQFQTEKNVLNEMAKGIQQVDNTMNKAREVKKKVNTREAVESEEDSGEHSKENTRVHVKRTRRTRRASNRINYTEDSE